MYTNHTEHACWCTMRDDAPITDAFVIRAASSIVACCMHCIIRNPCALHAHAPCAQAQALACTHVLHTTHSAQPQYSATMHVHGVTTTNCQNDDTSTHTYTHTHTCDSITTHTHRTRLSLICYCYCYCYRHATCSRVHSTIVHT